MFLFTSIAFSDFVVLPFFDFYIDSHLARLATTYSKLEPKWLRIMTLLNERMNKFTHLLGQHPLGKIS